MFDVPPAATLVVFVLVTAKLPGWALGSIGGALGIGVLLMGTAMVLARRQHRELNELGRARLLLARGREGLAIMRTPKAAALAVTFQYLGWFCQLLAVWAAMRAFHIYRPMSVAGLVLVLINVVTIVPFWPGNIGVVQNHDRDVARRLQRRVRARLRVRHRPAGDRGVDRRGRRSDLPRARGAVVRDAARLGRAGRGRPGGASRT